jgi:hypothetical protein
MLSALIPSVHSYPALQLVPKPVDQRYVQPGPLVLGPTPLKCLAPAADRDRPVSRIFLTNYFVYGLYHLQFNIGDRRLILLKISRIRSLKRASLYGPSTICYKFLINSTQIILLLVLIFVIIIFNLNGAGFPRYYPNI